MDTKTRIQTRKKPRDAVKPKLQAALDAGNVQEVIDNLTVRQRRFVEEYLVDFNGAAAVTRAGYNSKHPNRLAYELLHNPAVKAAIDQITLERASEATLKPEYVLKKLQRTIEKAEKENNHSAVLRGCEILARTLGMFVERKEISGPNGDAIKLQEVREGADAFTRAIGRLIERSGEDKPTVVIGTGGPE